ncbi:MAG: hypothetical protein FWD75_03425 [Propionibacteriaceae bacterium]|nr:hypothetical protein [Propionibacteriaceae bacterium]
MDNAIRPLLTLTKDGDAIYALTRKRQSSGCRRFFDLVLDFFFLAGGTDAVADSLAGTWYLLASDSDGRLVKLHHGVINETTVIPQWDAKWKESFSKVSLDGFDYKRLHRLV